MASAKGCEKDRAPTREQNSGSERETEDSPAQLCSSIIRPCSIPFVSNLCRWPICFTIPLVEQLVMSFGRKGLNFKIKSCVIQKELNEEENIRAIESRFKNNTKERSYNIILWKQSKLQNLKYI